MDSARGRTREENLKKPKPQKKKEEKLRSTCAF